MMYCIYCGKEVENGSKFSSYCGKSLNENQAPEKTNVKEKVFAFIGFGLGICSFIFSLIPFLCFSSAFISIPGLIFSNLGINSNKKSFAKKGRIFSILGIIIGVIVSFLSIVLLVFLVEEAPIIYEIIYDLTVL